MDLSFTKCQVFPFDSRNDIIRVHNWVAINVLRDVLRMNKAGESKLYRNSQEMFQARWLLSSPALHWTGGLLYWTSTRRLTILWSIPAKRSRALRGLVDIEWRQTDRINTMVVDDQTKNSGWLNMGNSYVVETLPIYLWGIFLVCGNSIVTGNPTSHVSIMDFQKIATNTYYHCYYFCHFLYYYFHNKYLTFKTINTLRA